MVEFHTEVLSMSEKQWTMVNLTATLMLDIYYLLNQNGVLGLESLNEVFEINLHSLYNTLMEMHYSAWQMFPFPLWACNKLHLSMPRRFSFTMPEMMYH